MNNFTPYPESGGGGAITGNYSLLARVTDTTFKSYPVNHLVDENFIYINDEQCDVIEATHDISATNLIDADGVTTGAIAAAGLHYVYQSNSSDDIPDAVRWSITVPDSEGYLTNKNWRCIGLILVDATLILYSDTSVCSLNTQTIINELPSDFTYSGSSNSWTDFADTSNGGRITRPMLLFPGQSFRVDLMQWQQLTGTESYGQILHYDGLSQSLAKSNSVFLAGGYLRTWLVRKNETSSPIYLDFKSRFYYTSGTMTINKRATLMTIERWF